MKLEFIFAKCLDISKSKAQDYTSSNDPHENFKRSAEIASWFPEKDKSFVVLIGTKLARLGSLLSKNSKPNNESIEDSFLDLVNYCALWAEFRTSPSRSFVPGPNDRLMTLDEVEKMRLTEGEWKSEPETPFTSGFNGTAEQEKEYDSPLHRKRIALAVETRYFSEEELQRVLSLVRGIESRKIKRT